MIIKKPATIEDLYRIDGKGELVNGEVELMAASGFSPTYASLQIVKSLEVYAEQTQKGFAVPDNAGFVVDLPHRQSFSPDAAYFVGEDTGMKFLNGAPLFAAEVRSEGDYGPFAERKMALKRRDYFAAGTVVVWDVDLQSEDVVRVYRSTAPESPTIFRRGEIAEAEPAAPGWSFPVDKLFRAKKA